MIGKRRLVDRFQIVGGHNGFSADITEQRDFAALFFWNWLFGATDKNIRRNPDGLKFFDRVLRWFCFKLTRGRQIRKQRQVHKDALATRLVMAELADGFEKRQAFDVADRAANFAQHKINFVIANVQEIFDFVGDVGHDLNGFPQIIAAPFFFENVRVNPA